MVPVNESTVIVRRDVLRSWLKVSGRTQSALARDLNVTKGRISQLINLEQEPSARVIAGLLHVTNLPFDRLFVIKQRKLLHSRLKSQAGALRLGPNASLPDSLRPA